MNSSYQLKLNCRIFPLIDGIAISNFAVIQILKLHDETTTIYSNFMC